MKNNTIDEFFSKAVFSFKNDSLFRNSLYLMLSTGIMSGLGFISWMINARLFTIEQIGYGSTIISTILLLSNIGLLGLNNSLIKFLPNSDRKNLKISTALFFAILFSLLASFFFIFFWNTLTPKLAFLSENKIFLVSFIIAIILSTIGNIVENIFVAYKSAKYVFIKSTIFGFIKVITPFFFVGLGLYGVYLSYWFATLIAIIYSIVLLINKFCFSIKIPDLKLMRRMFRFSIGTYLASLISSLPSLLLPILITNLLGSRYTAFFFVDLMIVNLLYIIPIATSQSFFAEGSFNGADVKTLFKKTSRTTLYIMAPSILMLIFLGRYILLIFGTDYVKEGVYLLNLLAISGVFMGIKSIGGSLLLIQHRLKLNIYFNFIGTISTLTLSFLFSEHFLNGIGFAWLVGQVITAIFFAVIIFKYFRQKKTLTT